MASLRNSEGQFSGTAPKKTTENNVKHCDSGVGSMVAKHCSGGKSSVVVTTLPEIPAFIGALS